MGKKVVFPYEVDKIIVGFLINFAKDIDEILEESGFDLDYSNIIICKAAKKHIDKIQLRKISVN